MSQEPTVEMDHQAEGAISPKPLLYKNVLFSFKHNSKVLALI